MDKDKDLFIDPQEFVVGYSKAPEHWAYMSFSHYDEHGARTSHHMHCCIEACRATHYATGDNSHADAYYPHTRSAIAINS